MYKGRFSENCKESEDDLGYVETDPTGRYGRFEEVLGKGAMKKVYRGIDELLGMEVAWSQIKLNDLLQSPEDIERLYSEVHLLSTLNHKSIMRFYTSWIDVEKRTFNFITEMFTSGTLRGYRKKYQRVDIRAVKIWARQILEGLVYLHEHDPPVIHRDLKCDNIFVNGHLGQVKIGDLGLAAILRGSQRAHSVIGTPEFMAPELYDENYNELVDVYSFGMCMLETLTGEYPQSEIYLHALLFLTQGKRPRAFYKVQDLDAQRFIRKCLEPASNRLSAKELMLDPFLVINDADGESVTMMRLQKPILNDKIAIEDLHLSDDAPRTNMTITGKLNPEDDTIFLKVQIADKEGDVRNVYFPFDIVTDTPTEVANEMVKELEITDWKPHEIANMIDGEISGLVPQWKKWNQFESIDYHVLSYKDDDNDRHNPFQGFSSSSSQVSLSGLLSSQVIDVNTKDRHWLHGDTFDDTSSQSSSYSANYSNFNYFSDDEYDHVTTSTRQSQPATAISHHTSRFCPEENSSTGQSLARTCYKKCKAMVELKGKTSSTSKEKGKVDTRGLTRNRSLVDMRSQLLHKSLVEEVHKRRLFKTIGAVENIGFQQPYEDSKRSHRSMNCTYSKRLSSDGKGQCHKPRRH
ncbi:hypothetical protein RND71_024919 [Anisodus tanguticus]|uniref:non-specific serine/threonine protein kinase n=1 Tax=Anisodus tanguticus TaxID=243964 RepID=A0AAE1RQF7_9SOLA|nr:hypothetical protein RND71_024919 [Anisodus tanguticus]